MREGNGDALEGLIRGPAEGRSNWQMGSRNNGNASPSGSGGSNNGGNTKF